MADTPFVARKGLVSLGDITGSGHLQISTVDGLATATEALFLDSTDTVVSRSLGDSAFQDTGSMTVFNADSADTATTTSNVTIGTLTTAGEYDILYTANGSKISQDTSGEFTYDPDANLLSVDNLFTSTKGIITELTSSKLQVANIDYPTSDGTSGQVITTNGSGQLTFTTIAGGTDTNIANTDLTATANRTLDMGTNDLTISASQFFIDTTGGTFEVDARNGDFRVISDTGHDIELQGLPNTETPNIVGYNTATGRLSYYSTGSFSGGGGSTVYTPDVYEIETQNTITATTTLDLAATNTNPTILDGTTGTSRDASQVNAVNFNSTGVFEITYTVNLSHGDPATDNRMNPAIYAKAGDIGPSGTLSEVHGSLNATYIRLPGTNQAPNGSIHGKFYYNNTSTQNSVVLFITFLGTTSNPDIDVVNHISGLKNTLTIRKIS